MKKEKHEHYWYCVPCAESRGAKFPEGHVCTMIKDTCKYCKTENVLLVPWVDFDWPNQRTEHLRD